MYSVMLAFITVKNTKDEHNVIFLNRREVEGTYPNQAPHWYNSDIQLHNEDRVYGWSCVGTSAQVDEVLRKIESKSEIIISKDKYNISLKFNSDKEVIEKGENSLDDSPSVFDKYQKKIASIDEHTWLAEISSHCHSLLDPIFCDHISGIKKSIHNYGILTPPGFWAEGELLNYFKNSVIAVSEIIVPHITFRGTGDLKKTDIKGFTGLCQHFPAGWDKIKLNFYDIDKKNLLHSLEVKLLNGWAKWEAIFDNPPAQGVVEVRKESVVVGANKYYLLLNINIDIKTDGGSVVFKDTYGRTFSIEKKEAQTSPVRSLNWNSDYVLKPQSLSDDLTSILSQLGNHVLIQDPYLIGGFSDGEKVTRGSESFLNALVISIVSYSLKEITFLVDSKKLKLGVEGKNKISNYIKKLFQNLKQYGLDKVTIAYAKNSFHDRYFMGLSSVGGLYHVSKSVNGFLESDDLNIYQYDGDQKKELKAQILYRLNQAEKEVIIG